jgi:hypothetical protein
VQPVGEAITLTEGHTAQISSLNALLENIDTIPDAAASNPTYGFDQP